MLVGGQNFGKCISYSGGHIGCLSMLKIHPTGGTLKFIEVLTCSEC